MDNNQYYNNMGVQNGPVPTVEPVEPVQPVEPQPMPEVTPVAPVEPVQQMPNYNAPNYTEQAFNQPVYNQPYTQPVQNTPVQQANPTQLQTDPVINQQQAAPQPVPMDPNQVFGSNVVSEQIATTRTEQVSPLLQKHEEEPAPKYGAATEGQADLNEDKNGSLKFVIILGILVLAFIIALPYLSDIFSSFLGSGI